LTATDDLDPSREFFAAAAAGVLLARRCRACGGWAAPYSLRGVAYRDCPSCHESALAWEAASGKATLVTWTVVPDASFSSHPGATQISGLVELHEGPWLVCAIDVPPERLAVGAAVHVTFTRADDAVLIPTAQLT
jgi:uncharacterized OB-fold protein